MSAMFKKVLLLSSSYEPIAFCNMRKALGLIALNKAEAIEIRGDLKIKGVSKLFDCPSIIRLKDRQRNVKVKVQLNRKNIMKRDGFMCMYCGSCSELTIDHIVPKSKGGKTSWENLVTACTKCNNIKDDKFLHEAGFKLKTTPKMPNRIVFLRQEVNTIEENWKPYLYLM
jgi:5-methylcytosine-specific restriction endonuclease McrA